MKNSTTDRSSPFVSPVEWPERVSKERVFDHLVEVPGSGIALIAADGTRLYRSPTGLRMLGYASEEITGRDTLSLLHPDDLPRSMELLARLMSGSGGRVNSELRCKHVDGSWRWIEASGWNLLHEPSVQAIVVSYRDVTERRRSEERLRERARLAELQGEVASALAYGQNVADMLQQCSTAMVRHLGASFARIWSLNPATDMLELQASAGMYTHLDGRHSRIPLGAFKIGLIAAERRPHLTNEVIGDPRVRDQDWAKREGMVAFAGYPLLVDDRVVGVMAMFAREPLSMAVLQAMEAIAHSIAVGIERKRSDAQIRQLNAELEQRVRERTVQLEEANKELEAFSYSVSHDLRAPLRTIDAFAQLLADHHAGGLTDNGRQCAEMIRLGSNEMVGLIDALLEFSQSGRGPVKTQLVEPAKLVGTIVEELRKQEPDRNVEVTVGDLPPCYADPTLLKQVFVNLLSNAFKYTRKRKVGRIEIGSLPIADFQLPIRPVSAEG